MKTNNDFVLREIYGKAILMPIKKNDISDFPLYLNDVAVTVWKKASMSMNRKELLSKLRETYHLEKNSKEEKMLYEFMMQLFEMKLLID